MRMMLVRMIAGFCLAAALGGPGPATATAEMRHQYGLSVAGVRVGVLELAANIENGAYAATGGVYSSGIVGALFPFSLLGSAAGRINGDLRIEPVRYNAMQQDGDDRFDVEMRYTRGVPSFVEWTPPRKSRKHDIAPADQGGTLDPISAGLAILKELPEDRACGREVQVYDGSKRSLIRIGKPQRAGDRVVCTGVYKRVAGFSPSKMKEKVDFPFTITYDVADGLLSVRSIEMDSVIGRAVMYRR